MFFGQVEASRALLWSAKSWSLWWWCHSFTGVGWHFRRLWRQEQLWLCASEDSHGQICSVDDGDLQVWQVWDVPRKAPAVQNLAASHLRFPSDSLFYEDLHIAHFNHLSGGIVQIYLLEWHVLIRSHQILSVPDSYDPTTSYNPESPLQLPSGWAPLASCTGLHYRPWQVLQRIQYSMAAMAALVQKKHAKLHPAGLPLHKCPLRKRTTE